MEKKKVTVFVAGHKLNLLTTESEKYVTDIASKVDTAVMSMLTSTNMSKEKCAVMVALDYCDDEAKQKSALNEIKEQIKDYIEDVSKLRAENDELKSEIEKLKAEKSELLASKKTMVASAVEIKDEEKIQEQAKISSDDDLSFDLDVTDNTNGVEIESETPPTIEEKPSITAPVAQQKNFSQPATKNDKKRHQHNHVNPYKERFMQQKNEQKGYTPVRQYSFFDEKDN
ncbi:MAG: cell division protein ZapA [Ruminococcaceae bacterium]|nr:cell division protein ZapA [Oscillospiraceae bacterium]